MLIEKTIHVDAETGQVLNLSKEELEQEYIITKSEKHVKDFKITWVTIWTKSKNPRTEQRRIW